MTCPQDRLPHLSTAKEGLMTSQGTQDFVERFPCKMRAYPFQSQMIFGLPEVSSKVGQMWFFLCRPRGGSKNFISEVLPDHVGDSRM